MSLENLGILISIIATLGVVLLGYFKREDDHKEKNHQLELRIQRLEDKLSEYNQIFTAIKDTVANQLHDASNNRKLKNGGNKNA